MSTNSYSITCISSQGQQMVLLKMLLQWIVGNRPQDEIVWTYQDTIDNQNRVDVLFLDYDDGSPPLGRYDDIPVIVGFSRDESRTSHISFHMKKPLRSSDLVTLLVSVGVYLRRRHTFDNKEHSLPLSVQATTSSPAHTEELLSISSSKGFLDDLLALMTSKSEGIYSLYFDAQTAWFDASRQKLFLPTAFEYANITPSYRLKARLGATLPSVSIRQLSIADFFYEFTIQNKHGKLLDELGHSDHFHIKQWPRFHNSSNTKSSLRAAAYFSKQKSTLHTASIDLSLDTQSLIAFINAAYSQNLLVATTDSTIAPTQKTMPEPYPSQPVTEEKQQNTQPSTNKLGGLFGRIRSRFGI